HRQHVGVVLPVVREHRRDDLRLAVEALREERADRAIDQARREDLLLRGPPLPLEEAARDLARRERLLLVVTGEREEIDAFARGRTRRGRDQHDRLAELDERRSARLLRHPPRLDRQGAAVKLDLYSLVARSRHAVFSLRRRPQPLVIWRGGQGGGGLNEKPGSYFRMPRRSITLLYRWKSRRLR